MIKKTTYQNIESSEHMRASKRGRQGPVPTAEEEKGGNVSKCQERWLCRNGCPAEAEVSSQGTWPPTENTQGCRQGISHLTSGTSSYFPYGQTQSKAREQEFDAVLNSSASPCSERDGTRWSMDLEGAVETAQGGCCKRDSYTEQDIPIVSIDTTELVSPKKH